jgi:hypothetical protein
MQMFKASAKDQVGPPMHPPETKASWSLPTLQEAREQPPGGQRQLCHHPHRRAVQPGGNTPGQLPGLELGLLLWL